MLSFKLVTLDGVKNEGQIYEAILPTPNGQIGVFEHHAPLVSIIERGVIKVRVKPNDPDDFMEVYATNGGIVEIADNEIKVLADEADAPDEINELEMQKSHEQARQLLSEAKDQVSLDHAQSMLDRSSVRLKVATMKRRRRSGGSQNPPL
ncbi:ATP synthase F1 subunit epsilon [Candidatus Saccharibacteria bacterium]|nr:ATP synthase F1 subunit epsilon [Candidatus Saccharibacteria bacterium]